MKRFFGLLAILIMAGPIKAEDYIETFNLLSENYNNYVQDAKIIREIGGGTVITPVFDATCPEEIKAPFAYACKIVEEYMPPCLPLKVKVSCGRLSGSYQSAISKVLALSKENFGWSNYHNTPMSMIKGVILGELGYNTRVSFLDSVPDVEFLTQYPDIDITYNETKLNDLSFSLNPDPGQKYDFVSVAIRDLLIGLGISSSYTTHPLVDGLVNPRQEMTPFEYFINEALGNYGNPSARLEAATKGELVLKEDVTHSLKLYAPTTWINKTSLNYFIPQDDSCVSNILSYEFCKGMVTRSLSDRYSDFIFKKLLGWQPNFPTSSTGGSSASNSGSTSMLMPYNGSISFDANSKYGIRYSLNSDESDRKKLKNGRSYSDNEELQQYISSFHPYDSGDSGEWTEVSILKKDGTWDTVKSTGNRYSNITFCMSDLTFHCDEEEYARTIDGYMRARITSKENTGKSSRYHSIYFVIDYLPQKVKLGYKYNNTTTASITNDDYDPGIPKTTTTSVRIYFSDTEGINRIVLERLRSGFRVPSKIEITDFKDGYYDTTIDRATTFTAIGYNDNGSSRGVSITIIPSLPTPSTLNFKYSNDRIVIESANGTIDKYDFNISPLNLSNSQSLLGGKATGTIDVSTLSEGMYILTIKDNNSNIIDTFKFKKN